MMIKKRSWLFQGKIKHCEIGKRTNREKDRNVDHVLLAISGFLPITNHDAPNLKEGERERWRDGGSWREMGRRRLNINTFYGLTLIVSLKVSHWSSQSLYFGPCLWAQNLTSTVYFPFFAYVWVVW